ncbi:hypothetical protein TWF694_011078 [Orbilia ellipsospora]|uniref:Uncharacterized protein n=1 Tax=Orbilia ellipsospora TaxID=2528407 RepID=A0AAV9X973_9PEZI
MPRAKSSKRTSKLAMVPTQVPEGRSASDIIISASEEELEEYTSQEKQFLFRVKPWGTEVSRIWLYIKDPVKSVTHVATVGKTKVKGELDEDVKNGAAFNKGSLHGGRGAYRAAYEILSMSELEDPMAYSHLIEKKYTRAIGNANVYVCDPMVEELEAIESTELF